MKKFNELSSEDFTQILNDRKEIEILIDYQTLSMESLKLMEISNPEVIIKPKFLNQDNYKLLLIEAIESKDSFLVNLLSWQNANAIVFCKKYNDDLYKLRIVF